MAIDARGKERSRPSAFRSPIDGCSGVATHERSARSKRPHKRMRAEYERDPERSPGGLSLDVQVVEVNICDIHKPKHRRNLLTVFDPVGG